MRALKRHRKQIFACAALLLGVAVIAFTVWVFTLDRTITSQFEGRRWTLPAQVYAQPTELYVGQSFSAETLEDELKRLGYQRVDKPQHPGSYSRRGARVDLINRRFQFWDALQEPQLLTISTRGNAIEDMRNGRNEEVPIFRLDPLLIGSIFPIHGEDRVVVTPEEVSTLLPKALKVVEDRKFDSHLGVNVSAIIRAAWTKRTMRARRGPRARTRIVAPASGGPSSPPAARSARGHPGATLPWASPDAFAKMSSDSKLPPTRSPVRPCPISCTQVAKSVNG